MSILKNKIKKNNQHLQRADAKPILTGKNEAPVPNHDLRVNITTNNSEINNEKSPEITKGVLNLDVEEGFDHNRLMSTSCGSNNSASSRNSRSTKNSSRVQRRDSGKYKNPTKNISVNYGKAIISFAISHVALPYLGEYFEDFSDDYNRFINFLKDCRKKLKGMHTLKAILGEEKGDSDDIIEFKRIFRMIGETFIKYFSINWIAHSKLTEKLIYLKYRYKMIRRIRNPELFTYIHKNQSSGLEC
jgi:hypothetical protein